MSSPFLTKKDFGNLAIMTYFEVLDPWFCVLSFRQVCLYRVRLIKFCLQIITIADPCQCVVVRCVSRTLKVNCIKLKRDSFDTDKKRVGNQFFLALDFMSKINGNYKNK